MNLLVNLTLYNGTDPYTHIYIYIIGVRYGESPTGSQRFRPVILANTTWDETYDATSFGDACIQPSTTAYPDQSEDCLFINIWTPSIDSNGIHIHTHTHVYIYQL